MENMCKKKFRILMSHLDKLNKIFIRLVVIVLLKRHLRLPKLKATGNLNPNDFL